MLRTTELDAVLQVGSHVGEEEGQNPAAHTATDAAQDAVGSLGCGCTFPGHVQSLICKKEVRFVELSFHVRKLGSHLLILKPHANL